MQVDTLSYDELKKEYENYQISSELQMQRLSRKIMKLERDINVLANIVEISKYININLSDENLISMINDMILGLFGVSYSTIFLHEDGEIKVKATNIHSKKVNLIKAEEKHIKLGESYLINDRKGIRFYEDTGIKICSVIGMPIKLREKYVGFILVEHTICNFLDKEHNKFLHAIASQIAIELENSMLYRELQETVKKDPLLGIYNRRYFFSEVEENIRKNPLKNYAVVMMDLDDFKEINDLYGHQFGDKVLIETAEILKKLTNNNDILARYGGEELIIYISDFIEKEEVINKVKNILMAIQENRIKDENVSRNITASIGIGFSDLNHEKKLNGVIKEADSLLYKAKAEGKNRIMYD